MIQKCDKSDRIRLFVPCELHSIPILLSNYNNSALTRKNNYLSNLRLQLRNICHSNNELVGIVDL